ncbi:hypothetical protein Zmor_010087 [Zophobas morio]|uniref:Gustatory receptor n=1 Tax=Zophobas morio TaxID=2755281 RepID=A0AA38MJJ0_9CUCU|nr:hypothetical protein Zmor_010087 [Zophobas morio]
MLVVYLYSKLIKNTVNILCHLKFFCAHVIVVSGEMLVFSYLMMLETVDICEDGQSLSVDYYKENEMLHLRLGLTKIKFTTYGFLELDWPLLFVMSVLISTHLIYLVQFKQMEN